MYHLIITVFIFFFISGCGQDDKLILSGIVEVQEVRLGFEENGYIEAIYYDVNDEVRQGAVIASLQNAEATKEYEALQYELKQAQYRLESMIHTPRKEELDVLRTHIAAAQAAFNNAKSELERSQELFKKRVETQQRFQQRTLEYDTAKANLESVKAEMILMQAGVKQEDLDAEKMAILALEHKAAALKGHLDKRLLSAPFDGLILTRNFEPKEYIKAGQSVVSMSDYKECWIMIYVPETEIFDIHHGDKVKVEFDAKKSPNMEAIVSEISQKAAFAPRMNLRKEQRDDLYFPLKIAIKNSDRRIKPGMVADVIFEH